MKYEKYRHLTQIKQPTWSHVQVFQWKSFSLKPNQSHITRAQFDEWAITPSKQQHEMHPNFSTSKGRSVTLTSSVQHQFHPDCGNHKIVLIGETRITNSTPYPFSSLWHHYTSSLLLFYFSSQRSHDGDRRKRRQTNKQSTMLPHSTRKLPLYQPNTFKWQYNNTEDTDDSFKHVSVAVTPLRHSMYCTEPSPHTQANSDDVKRIYQLT